MALFDTGHVIVGGQTHNFGDFIQGWLAIDRLGSRILDVGYSQPGYLGSENIHF